MNEYNTLKKVAVEISQKTPKLHYRRLAKTGKGMRQITYLKKAAMELVMEQAETMADEWTR